MEKRKEINRKIVDWIANKVQTKYPDDISLVCIYGSYVNGTANSKSDVDCYFVPKTERGYDFATHFMIAGVGYDIYPISWERLTRIADLQENMLPLVGDAQILYSNGSKDIAYFHELQIRLKQNLSNEEYTRKIAVQRCKEANNLCSLMKASRRASEVRKLSGNILMMLADAIAIYNHEYFHFGLKTQFDDLQNKLPNIPRDFIDGYRRIIEAVEINTVIQMTTKLLNVVCEYFHIEIDEKNTPAKEIPETQNAKIDAPWLAGLYEEISSTFNKIYICCESNNYILAFLSAVCLQRDLDDAKVAGCPIYDLLGNYHYKELSKFAICTQRIEADFVRLITEHGGHIRKYDSFEQFELANEV